MMWDLASAMSTFSLVLSKIHLPSATCHDMPSTDVGRRIKRYRATLHLLCLFVPAMSIQCSHANPACPPCKRSPFPLRSTTRIRSSSSDSFGNLCSCLQVSCHLYLLPSGPSPTADVQVDKPKVEPPDKGTENSDLLPTLVLFYFSKPLAG